MKECDYMIDVCFANFYIEITRRCNMNCIHCAKGKAQNLDITKNIVDKSMNELKNYYIHFLDIIGGEPFLNIDGFEYTIDSIIKNKLKLYQVYIFTNATIKDMRIVKAIQKLADYLKREKPLFALATKKYTEHYSSINYRYKTDVSKKDIVVVASTNYHNNSEMIKDTINYYNSKFNRDNAIAISQNEDVLLNDVNINFEGNVVENYKRFPDEAIQRIRLVDNHYCVIDDNTPDVLIDKAITISANGNVFIGYLSSYSKVDSELAMFNILDCNNSFYQKISEWCWKYPFTEKMHITKERYNAYKWLKKENRLNDNELSNAYSKININDGMALCESILKNLHNNYPTLTHSDVEKAFNCYLLLDIENSTDFEKEMILMLFSSFSDCEIKDIISDYKHNAVVAKKALISILTNRV